MKCHLHQVGEMPDQLHDVHAALGLVHQELQVGEVVGVGGLGEEDPLHGVLVDVAQQVLLVYYLHDYKRQEYLRKGRMCI